MINNFLLALVLTILIETTVLFMISIYWNLDKTKFSSKNIVFAGIMASSLTLPYLYFVFPYFLPWVLYIPVWEISVTLIEAVFYTFYFEIKFPKWLLISFLANFVSYSIWVILFWY